MPRQSRLGIRTPLVNRLTQGAPESKKGPELC